MHTEVKGTLMEPVLVHLMRLLGFELRSITLNGMLTERGCWNN